MYRIIIYTLFILGFIAILEDYKSIKSRLNNLESKGITMYNLSEVKNLNYKLKESKFYIAISTLAIIVTVIYEILWNY